jgi:hypothetical protein
VTYKAATPPARPGEDPENRDRQVKADGWDDGVGGWKYFGGW